MGKVVPGQGKGRLTAKREAEVFSDCRSRIRDAARRCFREGLSLSETIREMHAYTEHPEFSRLSRLSRTELFGYRSARMDSLNERTVWCLHIDGQLMTREEYDALSRKEREEESTAKGLGVPYTRLSIYDSRRLDEILSTHCWLDDKGNVRKDRPYSVERKECKNCGFPAEEHRARMLAGGCNLYHSA